MSARPLRQFYERDRTLTMTGLGSPVEPFRRHRARLLDVLRGLSEGQWGATTRCDAWCVKDVVQHLTTADGFWVMTLQGRHNAEPTTYLQGFDPTSSPDAVIAPRRSDPAAVALQAFEESTSALTATLSEIADDEWSLLSESPFGHVPLRVLASHSLWDSWLHERDILLPMGRQPAVEVDELETAVAFSLFLGGSQGGVLDDDAPVGPGPDVALGVQLSFDDAPGRSFGLRVDRDVRVEVTGVVDVDAAIAAGSGVDFVDAVTGRGPMGPVLGRLPADLAAQLERARLVL